MTSRNSLFGDDIVAQFVGNDSGSTKAMAGESALAHNGILFFDEFPHFSKSVLESLREPLEDNQILISRVNSKVKYDTKFLFAAAQNPCPCGNLFSMIKECRCNEMEINRYKTRISEPLMDRIDLYVQMNEDDKEYTTVSSQEMFDEVLRAFKFQKSRKQLELNAKLSESELEKVACMSEEAEGILLKAANKYGLSYRSIYKVRSIARSIADIVQCEKIQKEHILEALSFRRR